MRLWMMIRAGLASALAMPLAAQASPDATTPDPDRLSIRVAVGATAQDETGRATFGQAFSFGVARRIGERLGWTADLTLERFDRRASVVYICLPDEDCPVPTGRATLIGGNAELVWGESSRPSPYLLAGGGVTRMLASGSAFGSTYPHVGVGVGWRFATGGAEPFLELRWKHYVSSGAPMSSWTAPVLVGFSF